MKKTKTPLGIIGIIYIVIGIILNIIMFVGKWWPTYLFFILIGIGFFFLLLNRLFKKLRNYKLLQIIIGISPLIIFGIFLQMNKSSEDIFLIKNDFRGTIVIIYGQKDGAEKEFENKKRIYRIPKNGILKTQFELKGNKASFGEYYYELNEKMRIKIEQFSFDKPFPDSTKTYVHSWLLGNAQKSGGNEFTYQQVTIGSKKDNFEKDIFKIIEE